MGVIKGVRMDFNTDPQYEYFFWISRPISEDAQIRLDRESKDFEEFGYHYDTYTEEEARRIYETLKGKFEK